jgi:hypothetical protein
MPADASTLESQFQIRRRDLITELRTLGFDSWSWVGLVNEPGAAEAAEAVLAGS